MNLSSSRRNTFLKLQLPSGGKRNWLLIAYAVLISLPFLATQALDMNSKGMYLSLLGVANVVAIAAFFIQFPLSSRIKSIPLFANIDWSMSKHKKVGKWLGLFFLLHPILILAPRFSQSYTDGMTSLLSVITAPTLLTGIIAWFIMIVWVLMSIFKNALPVKYETWRLLHMLGFVVIAILATMHITTVGSHGQFENYFNTFWWLLCVLSVSLVVYNYTIKKVVTRKTPFVLTSIEKASRSDWQLTFDSSLDPDFHFEAGQFLWINTSNTAFSTDEHPFSIASCSNDLPKVTLIIRELGDYTSSLSQLKVGQNVFIDGPYGSVNVNDSQGASSVLLIAGGAGIGPILGLLKEFSARGDTRPIRLIYGNTSFDQMVQQNQIAELESSMNDFKQLLVCENSCADAHVYQGVIDTQCINSAVEDFQAEKTSVYLCGPEGMIVAVRRSLKTLGIRSANLHYEKLSF